MKKIERILVVALVVLLACYLLFPTLKWYSLTSPEDRMIATSGITAIRDTARKNALDDTNGIKAELGKNKDLKGVYPIAVEKAKETYKEKGRDVPSEWTAENILGAYDSEMEAVFSFESYYRDRYLSLKKTSGRALKLGLDLRGGMSVLLDGDVNSLAERLGYEPSQEEISEAIEQDIEILRMRIDQYGVSEAEIRRQGTDQILVEVPGDVDPERVQSFLRGQGTLHFAIVDNALTSEFSAWAASNYTDLFDENGNIVEPDWLPENRSVRAIYQNDAYGLETVVGYAVIDETQMMDASHNIASASIGQDQLGKPAVNFRLTTEGGDDLYNITQTNIGVPLAVLMDGKIKNIATINDVLSTNVQVTGFNEQEAKDLSVVLKTTQFPIDLTVASEERVGASLGEDVVSLAFTALIIGLSLIALFMIVYYGLAGVLSVVMLLIDMFVIVAVLSAFSFTLTLTSIAGLILTIGMAVDSSIIIFERIKEELAQGKSDASSIRIAFQKARWTLLDANITTMIAAVVLSFLGSSAVKGFANTLAIGIVCSLLCMLFILHLLLDVLVVDRANARIYIGKVKKFTNEEMLGGIAPKKTLPVVKASRAALIASAIFFVIGAGFFAVRGGFNLGIDFESGYVATVEVQGKNNKVVKIDEIRSSLGSSSYTVQNLGDDDNGMFIIKAAADNDEARQAVSANMLASLEKTFGKGKVAIVSETFIGAKFSSSLVTGSLLGIFVSLIFILVYIWIRFRLSFAIASVLALMHDVLLLLAFISFTGIEISSVTIAAILTIIGYSLNNTIVIFDRVRENVQLKGRKSDLKAILELSVTQSLKRTLFSSMTTILAVLPVAIFVTSEIRMFAIALVVGILIGAYSANFVSPNILRHLAKIKNPAFDPMQIKSSVEVNE